MAPEIEGRIEMVHDYGAGVSLEIGALLVPFTRACVPDVDVAGGRVTVVMPAEVVVPEPAVTGAGVMSWRATVLTLFPEMFPGPLGQSLAGRAMERGLWSLEARDIRAQATDRHRTVDDTPFGGGAGMVMRPDVVDAALAAVARMGGRWPC